MKELNITATTSEEQRIKAYLEENASDTLRDKIENGVPYEKDGLTLINRKTLSGFMEYACEEARKRAEKCARSACIEDQVVFGWAIHYFEEDSIIGTLYNADGTPYKQETRKNAPTLVKTTTTQEKPSIQNPALDKHQVPGQSSFFDELLSEEEQDEQTEIEGQELHETEEQPVEKVATELPMKEETVKEEPKPVGTTVTEMQTTEANITAADIRQNPHLYIDENGEVYEVDQEEDDRILEHICRTFHNEFLVRY